MPDLVLRSANDVQALLSGRLPPREDALILEGLPPDESTQRAARLQALRSECGCGMGAACALTGLALVVAWAVVQPPVGIGPQLGRGVVSLAAVMTAGGLGKATSLTRARRALRTELRAVRDRLQSQQEE